MLRGIANSNEIRKLSALPETEEEEIVLPNYLKIILNFILEISLMRKYKDN